MWRIAEASLPLKIPNIALPETTSAAIVSVDTNLEVPFLNILCTKVDIFIPSKVTDVISMTLVTDSVVLIGGSE